MREGYKTSFELELCGREPVGMKKSRGLSSIVMAEEMATITKKTKSAVLTFPNEPLILSLVKVSIT